jgi:hypothetical protein
MFYRVSKSHQRYRMLFHKTTFHITFSIRDAGYGILDAGCMGVGFGVWACGMELFVHFVFFVKHFFYCTKNTTRLSSLPATSQVHHLFFHLTTSPIHHFLRNIPMDFLLLGFQNEYDEKDPRNGQCPC